MYPGLLRSDLELASPDPRFLLEHGIDTDNPPESVPSASIVVAVQPRSVPPISLLPLKLEEGIRLAGVEPALLAWQTKIMPLDHSRVFYPFLGYARQESNLCLFGVSEVPYHWATSV
jgi:hypothetical protein